MFTTGTDDLVQLWDPNEAAFDTLYWFAALPGDRWSVPWTYGAVADFLVLDTLSTIIDGVILRQLVMGLDLPSPVAIDTLTGRLGFLTIFINAISPMFLLDQPIGTLRCYSDDEIQWVHPYWTFSCNSIMHVLDQLSPDLILHPNPGSDHFTLQLPHGDHGLKIFDQFGRIVMETTIISDRTVIKTTSLPPTSLPPGIYTVWITDRNGRSLHQRWIKERMS